MYPHQALARLPLSYVRAVAPEPPHYLVLRRFPLYSLKAVSPDFVAFQRLSSYIHFSAEYAVGRSCLYRLLRRNPRLPPHRSSRASRSWDARSVGGTSVCELWRLLRRSRSRYRPHLYRSRFLPWSSQTCWFGRIVVRLTHLEEPILAFFLLLQLHRHPMILNCLENPSITCLAT